MPADVEPKCLHAARHRRRPLPRAVAHARSGKGPSLVECLTYRWRGHSKSDRNLYRTQEEIKEWQQFDPIVRLTKTLLENKLFTQEEIDTIDKQAQQTIQEASDKAIQMPEPSPENMEAEVYAP